jgi:hypothetical protein
MSINNNDMIIPTDILNIIFQYSGNHKDFINFKKGIKDSNQYELLPEVDRMPIISDFQKKIKIKLSKVWGKETLFLDIICKKIDYNTLDYEKFLVIDNNSVLDFLEYLIEDIILSEDWSSDRDDFSWANIIINFDNSLFGRNKFGKCTKEFFLTECLWCMLRQTSKMINLVNEINNEKLMWIYLFFETFSRRIFGINRTCGYYTIDEFIGLISIIRDWI